MTKDRYVLKRVKAFVLDKQLYKQSIDPDILDDLIKQWEFDYTMIEYYKNIDDM